MPVRGFRLAKDCGQRPIVAGASWAIRHYRYRRWGGTPRCFLLSLALPESHTGRWLDLFLGGLRRASSKFQCVLAGGDTTRRNEILINVTVVGEVRAGSAALRSAARPGDILYVSGRLGEAEF